MKLFNQIFGSNSKRKNQLQSLARELNLKFAEKDETGLLKQLSDFKLFNKGRSKEIFNKISEHELLAENHLFDYHFVISAGNSHKRYQQTVFFINSKKLSLPQFYQKPENIFTKLLALLGIEDIDFENHPNYSDKYHLKGEYETVIRHYFTKDVLELLSSQKKMYMEGMNYYLILYQLDALCAPSNIHAFRNLALMIYKLFLVNSEKTAEFFEKEQSES